MRCCISLFFSFFFPFLAGSPRRLTHLCRIRIRRTMGKSRLSGVASLPLPQPIKNFLLHQN